MYWFCLLSKHLNDHITPANVMLIGHRTQLNATTTMCVHGDMLVSWHVYIIDIFISLTYKPFR